MPWPGFHVKRLRGVSRETPVDCRQRTPRRTTSGRMNRGDRSKRPSDARVASRHGRPSRRSCDTGHRTRHAGQRPWPTHDGWGDSARCGRSRARPPGTTGASGRTRRYRRTGRRDPVADTTPGCPRNRRPAAAARPGGRPTGQRGRRRPRLAGQPTVATPTRAAHRSTEVRGSRVWSVRVGVGRRRCGGWKRAGGGLTPRHGARRHADSPKRLAVPAANAVADGRRTEACDRPTERTPGDGTDNRWGRSSAGGKRSSRHGPDRAVPAVPHRPDRRTGRDDRVRVGARPPGGRAPTRQADTSLRPTAAVRRGPPR